MRYRIVPIPARIGANVRTAGTNRARTIVRDPYLSKYSLARATYSALNRREPGLNSDGPSRLPTA